MCRFIVISDTHSLHHSMKYDVKSFIDKNQENILIHAGDLTNRGAESEVLDFTRWIKNMDGFSKKIFIAGNHDFSFQEKPYWWQYQINDENLHPFNCYYLEDSEIIIESEEFTEPIKIYGSPWQPFFFNWAFNLPRNGDELNEKWSKIPLDSHIVITHGPAFGTLDLTPRNEHVGCELLNVKIDEIRPLIHIFGHIHHSYNLSEKNGIYSINASICTERYEPLNKPFVFDLRQIYGEFVIDIID